MDSGWSVLTYFLALTFWAPVFCEQDSCQAIHARSWGISLACCSTRAPLPDHCKYNSPHMCKFPHCSCTIIVDVDNVQCSDEAPRREWHDHETAPDDEPFQCRNPNFPNENGEFVLTLQIRSKPMTKPFLLGLAKYKVVELTLITHGFIKYQDGVSDQDDLFDYFRVLRSLRIFGSTNDTASVHGKGLKQDTLPSSFGGIDHLEMLSLVNLTSLRQLPEKVDFVSTLRYLLIQNCASLSKLPDWISDMSSLSYAKIIRTSVQNVSTLAALSGLKYLYLSQNKIVDISSIVFESDNLHELDLSANEICCIGTMTFSKLENLKYLDLSDNPLKRLPSGGFARLQNLQWLYLRHKVMPASAKKKFVQPSLESLNPDVLAGVKRLEYLSLENNPNVIIHHQALASLSSLKSLDLSYCNLSSLPESVVHLCNLKFLWLKFNRFRSSGSIHPSTMSMLPLNEMNVFDLSENSLTQNPYALFLVPLENTGLMESIVSALKHQPLWWHDPCARRHWRMRLVHTNANQTLKTFYANMLGLENGKTTGAFSSSSSDETQCDASYKKIMRELEPYETLKDSTTCSRLGEQRRLNRRYRQQLIVIQSNMKAANKDPNACRPPLVSEETHETNYDKPTEASNGVPTRQASPGHAPPEDPVDRAFNHARDDQEDELVDGTQLIPGGDSPGDSFGGDLPPPLPEDCSHLYSTIDVFGYVLAANFVVLISVSLSCIVLLCKQRRRTVETAGP